MDTIIYGEVRDNGELFEPTHCAFTGQPLVSGDAKIRIPGTKQWFCVKAEALQVFTPEDRARIIANAPQQKVVSEPVAISQPVTVGKQARQPKEID